MSEYVKACGHCGGIGRKIDRHRIGPDAWHACTTCNGTGQQLVKPIPEGAVVLTAEQFALITQDWCPPNRAPCFRGDDECEDCIRQWLKV